MKQTVFVQRPGGYKTEDAWQCTSQSEAEGLARWLRHLGVRNVKVISLDDHTKLPERQPE